MNWQNTKPTKPGTYMVRKLGTMPYEYAAIVTKLGRGFSVYCPEFSERVPMSQMGDKLQWAAVEQPDRETTA